MDKEIAENIYSTLDSRAAEIKEQLRKGTLRFVHYTSADNAMKIIHSGNVWMRNAKCMNDFMELSHGHELLYNLFRKESEIYIEFEKELSSINKSIPDQVFSNYNSWWNNIQINTFICSISEHDVLEDKHGRLSMWRAYGDNSAKAAFIIKAHFNPDPAQSLPLIIRPALYYTEDKLKEEILHVLNNIKNHRNFFSTLTPNILASFIFVWLLITTICLKHEGFKEEKEWRIIYLPQFQSYYRITLESEIVTIQGIPQLIYKIPLNIPGISIREIMDKIIIGPTQYPYPLSSAFIHELEKAGFNDAASRIVLSGIPLRT